MQAVARRTWGRPSRPTLANHLSLTAEQMEELDRLFALELDDAMQGAAGHVAEMDAPLLAGDR